MPRGRPARSDAKTRKDPVLRPLDASDFGTRLMQRNPKKHYVAVNANQQDVKSQYEWMGYAVEKVTQGGVNFYGGSKRLGDVITNKDTILMSIDKKRLKEIEAPGLERARDRSRLIRNKSGNRSLMGKARAELNRAFKGQAHIEDDIDMPSRGEED